MRCLVFGALLAADFRRQCGTVLAAAPERSILTSILKAMKVDKDLVPITIPVHDKPADY